MKTNIILLLLVLMPGIGVCQDIGSRSKNDVSLFGNKKTESPLHDSSACKNSKQNLIKMTKSPLIAVLVALIPGAIVRGSGHIYVKRYKTAVLLFSLYAIAIGTSLNNLYGNPSEEEINFINLLFFGTWTYDVIASPIICNRINKKARQATLAPYIRSAPHRERELGVRLSYRF